MTTHASDSLSSSPTLSGAALRRAEILLTHQQRKIAARTDKQLSRLIVAEWVATMITALLVSPRTWSGAESGVHVHVVGAIVLGGTIAIPAYAFVQRNLGRTPTRHIVAVAQMLMGALLIDVTGGRIETHFYIFGSLAFLAFYRDWRVIITATVVVLADHVARGVLLPASVFGVAHASVWRAFEHTCWVVFEDVFLIQSCLQSQREMKGISTRHAELELKMDVEARYVAAQEANRLKSEFLANMSHEIRTPMTAIQGYTDLLLDPSLNADERINHTQVIRRNSEHLLNVLNDVLDLSKIEAGKMTVEATDCCPARISVGGRVSHAARALRRRGWPSSSTSRRQSPRPSRATRRALRQVLLNLVGNAAIKFTLTGRVRIAVRCLNPQSLTPQIGVPGRRLRHRTLRRRARPPLPPPSAQADGSTTRKFGGSGLGLAICRSLAELLGGGIDVESAPGKGSAFTLTIGTGPLLGTTFVQTPLEALQEDDSTVVTSNRRRKIPLSGSVLLAEDGPDNQLLISTLLSKAGASVTIAENGRLAVEKALAARSAGTPFDVILMDMQMPELDGYAATSKLRSAGYRGAIIALTAHAMAGDRSNWHRRRLRRLPSSRSRSSASSSSPP